MRIGDISELSGEVIIASGDIWIGITAEQVAILPTQTLSFVHRRPLERRYPYVRISLFGEEDTELFRMDEQLMDNLVSRIRDGEPLSPVRETLRESR